MGNWTLIAVLFMGTPQQTEREIGYRLTWEQCVELGLKRLPEFRKQYPGAPLGTRCERGQAI